MSTTSYDIIVGAIRDRLLSIMKAPSFNYTLDRCEVAAWPSLEALDASYGKTLIIIAPETETNTEAASFTVLKEANVDLIAARFLKNGDQDLPWEPSRTEDTRTQAQNKLVEDTTRAIYGWDYTNFAENIEVITVDRAAERTNVDAWAVVFLTLRFSWEQVFPIE